VISRDEDGTRSLEVLESRVNGKLYKGRDDSKLVGDVNVNFTELAMLLYPGTSEEDWEDA
jgi:hypothetical protein